MSPLLSLSASLSSGLPSLVVASRTSTRSATLAAPQRSLARVTRSALSSPVPALHGAHALSVPKSRFFNTCSTARTSIVLGASATMTGVTADPKVAALRDAMKAANDGTGVDAYIIPSEDPHMSEYAPACQARRQFISGFTGSAGTAVVTTEAAALWTDGRYFLQAEEQLGEEWTLMKAGTKGCPDIEDWLADTLPDGAKIGIDPFLHTINATNRLRTKLEAAGKSLVTVPKENLVDAVWEAQPGLPDAPVRVHALEHAGESIADKLGKIRESMAAKKCDALLVTPLDEVAWLMNLRGSDVDHNPVFISYAMVTAEGATLYADVSKFGDDVKAHLQEGGVTIKAYDDFRADVATVAGAGQKLWMDPATVSYAIYEAAVNAAPKQGTKRSADGEEVKGAEKSVVLQEKTPLALSKAIKNEAEHAGMKEAHLRDGVAVAEFLSWLEAYLAEGKTLTECEIDEHLTARRAAQPGFIECSFPTIAGAGPNGAIIHYRAKEDTCRTVDSDTLLLIDSGGQYDCGTTDVTRTFHTGEPTDHQKTTWTRVLQGHISLDQAVFPEGTPGFLLDTLARAPLWKMGLNYRHGTGHGVGAALNVHEGPQQISFRYHVTEPLTAGMIVSNEPGYYEDGAFGIRIENLLRIVEAGTEFNFGDQKYYGFAPLTLIPLQKKMIKRELLSADELAWINKYHATVEAEIAPRMKEGAALDWLKAACAPLE